MEDEFEVDPDFEVNVPKRKGIVVPFDDVKVGDWIAVYRIKDVDTPQPIYGQALKVASISLPFVIGRLASERGNPPVTLDSRFLEVVRVSEEYATAQSVQGNSPEANALNALASIIRPNR